MMEDLAHEGLRDPPKYSDWERERRRAMDAERDALLQELDGTELPGDEPAQDLPEAAEISADDD